MIDYNKISKGIHEELTKLIGKSKAEKYINSVDYNYRLINNKILLIHLYRFIKKRLFEIILVLLIALVGYLLFLR